MRGIAIFTVRMKWARRIGNDLVPDTFTTLLRSMLVVMHKEPEALPQPARERGRGEEEVALKGESHRWRPRDDGQMGRKSAGDERSSPGDERRSAGEDSPGAEGAGRVNRRAATGEPRQAMGEPRKTAGEPPRTTPPGHAPSSTTGEFRKAAGELRMAGERRSAGELRDRRCAGRTVFSHSLMAHQ